jgi:hypothetical protein
MNELFVSKFVAVEREVASEKGPFSLFALLLREEFVDVASTSSTGLMTTRWDVVTAAPWLSRTKADYDYLVGKVQAHLSSDEMLSISRFVVLDGDAPLVEAFHRTVNGIEHGRVEIRNSVLFGLNIQLAYVITSKRQSASSKAHRRQTTKVAKAR